MPMEKHVPKLVITGADGASREIDLTTRDLRIGRAPENDLSLPDPTKGVSRMHAELRYENGRYVITDLNSQNGTWLDGTRVQRADVASGSEIAIGSYRLLLVGTGSPESKTPADINAVAARTIKVDAPARPAPPALPPLPPKRPATRDVPASAASGPLAGLSGLPKPLVFGGFFAVALIIIVVARLLFAPAEPAPSTTAMADLTTAAPSPAETNAQIIERHLAEARTLTAREDYESAIRDHLDQILLIDPNHAEAVKLKMQAQDAGRAAQTAASNTAVVTPPPAEVPTATAPPPPAPATSVSGKPPTTAPTAGGSTAGTKVPPRSGSPAQRTPAERRGTPSTASPSATTGRAAAPAETLPSPRRANETPQQWRTRNADLTAQYNAAKGELERRNFAAAISAFEALVKGEPDYLDAPQLLARAREELKAGGKEAYDAGVKAEAAGNWIVAIENYERAQKIDGALGAGEAARRVSEKMHAAAVEAFKRARQFDAVGRTADALKEYTNAAQWLPDTDANKAVARQRADQLRAGQR
jgi:predicted component of type VI protein secretion system